MTSHYRRSHCLLSALRVQQLGKIMPWRAVDQGKGLQRCSEGRSASWGPVQQRVCLGKSVRSKRKKGRKKAVVISSSYHQKEILSTKGYPSLYMTTQRAKKQVKENHTEARKAIAEVKPRALPAVAAVS